MTTKPDPLLLKPQRLCYREYPDWRCPLGAAMLSQSAWEKIGKSLRLSGRELRILQGVFNDCTERGIAHELKISSHTVHTHCERLYRKLGVTDRVKLVLRVVSEFLVLTVSSDNDLPPICAELAGGKCPLRLPQFQ